MKKIYIVLTHTGTNLSKIIKYYTKNEFSHVSIALDKELKQMYSFGRVNPYNPFWAGFVHEEINKGTFKRFEKTLAQIYSLDVTENQYKIISNQINKIQKNSKKYKFNILGLLAVALNKKIHLKHSFYCAEFVKYLLEKSGIETNLPEIIKPEDFKKLKGVKKQYMGELRKYKLDELRALRKMKVISA